MYGWLESGGATSVSSTFHETTAYDVILRTSYATNKLVLGNSNNTVAGMYIMGNNVGVSKPNPTKALDVHGEITCDYVTTYTTNPECNQLTPYIDYRIEVCASNIRFEVQTDKNTNSNPTTTMYLDSFGVLSNRIIIADKIKTRGQTLSNMYIKSVYPNDMNDDHVISGYTMLLEVAYQDYFIPNDMFLVDRTFFQVINNRIEKIDEETSHLVVTFKMYLPEQNATPFPFQSESNIPELLLLENLDLFNMPTLSNLIENNILYKDVLITEYEYGPYDLRVTFDVLVDHNRDGFFKKGSYYHVKTLRSEETLALIPNNILLLTSYEPVFDINNPSSIRNIRLTFANPETQKSVFDFASRITILIDENRYKEEPYVSAAFFPLEVVNYPGADSPEFININVAPGSNLIGHSNVVYNIAYSNDMTLLNYTLNRTCFNNYVGHFAYILDMHNDATQIWSIQDYTACNETSGQLILSSAPNLLDMDLEPYFNFGRWVKIMPFRYASYNIIGDKKNSCFIPFGTKLGVGTFEVSETLTSGGTLSCRDDFYIYNDASHDGFNIAYHSNKLSLNEAITIQMPDTEPESCQIQLYGCTALSNHIAITTNSNDVVYTDGTQFVLTHRASSNLILDNFGQVQAKIVNAEDLRDRIFTLSNITLLDVTYPATVQDVHHKWYDNVIQLRVPAIHHSRFQSGDLIRIWNTSRIMKQGATENSVFKVVRWETDESDNDRTILISVIFYSSHELQQAQVIGSIPFEPQDKVKIDILREDHWKDTPTTVVPCLVHSFAYIADGLNHKTRFSMEVSIHSPNLIFLSVGRFFNIRSQGSLKDGPDAEIDNVVLLAGMSMITSIDPNVPSRYHLEFKAIDNQTKLDTTTINECISSISPGADNAYLYIYPLESFFQPNRRQFPYNQYPDSVYPYHQHTESNVYLGFAAEHNNITYLILRYAHQLQSYFSEDARYIISPIDRLVLDSGVYDVAGLYVFQDHLLAIAKQVNNNMLSPHNSAILSWSFNGIPLKVGYAHYVADPYSVILMLENVDPLTLKLLKLYVSHNIYIMDKYAIVWHLVNIEERPDNSLVAFTIQNRMPNASQFSAADFIDFAKPRHIWVVPLKYFSQSMIGNERYDNYMPSKLGIKTKFIKETLTVGGDLSIKDSFVINSESSQRPWHISYCNDCFKMNDVFHISTSNIFMNIDLDCASFVVARNFYTNSDQRLKKNIQDVDPLKDLELLSKIDVKEFEFIGNQQQPLIPSRQKGIIAQEIEQILPNVVSERIGFIPNICLDAKVLKDAFSVCIDKLSFKDATHIPQIGEHIRIISDGQPIDSQVTSILNKQDAVCITTTGSYKLYSRVFVYGTQAAYKAVDYNYLFMTGVNAIKALYQVVKDMKSNL